MKTKLVTITALLMEVLFVQSILRGSSTAIMGDWRDNLLLLVFMAAGLLGLLLALRWQGLGGLISLLASVPVGILVYQRSQANPLVIMLIQGFPFFIAGGVNLIPWWRKRRSKQESVPMALEILHMLLRKEGMSEQRIDAIEKEKFGVTLRELVNAGIYQPKLEMEFDEGEKENLLDLMDKPSERYKSLTHDEARMLHIPERLKEEAIQSLRAVKTQPHFPYRHFCEFVRASPASQRRLYSNQVRTQLRRMLFQEKAGAFASLCMDCETVIGLHKAPDGTDTPQFTAALTTVGAQSGWTCPECGSSQWAFMRSGALNTGYPLDRLIPLELREMMH